MFFSQAFNKNQVFICCFILLTATSVRAKNATLSLSPTVCVVNEMGKLCRMNVQVNWQADVVGDYCLFQAQQQLDCWQNSTNIETQLAISLEENALFTLRNGEVVLAEKLVQVNATVPTSYRRKLRAQWSVF